MTEALIGGLIGVLVGAAITITFEWWGGPKIQKRIRKQERVEEELTKLIRMLLDDYERTIADAQQAHRPVKGDFDVHHRVDNSTIERFMASLDDLDRLHQRYMVRLTAIEMDNDKELRPHIETVERIIEIRDYDPRDNPYRTLSEVALSLTPPTIGLEADQRRNSVARLRQILREI